MNTISIINDVNLVYETFGDKNDQPILLVPGAGAPKEFWVDFFCRSLVNKGFFVIRYSHRDTDLSTHFDRDYTINEIVQDMIVFITRITDKPVHVIGHSMGGFIVQLAAIESVHKFKSITSIASGSVVLPEHKKKLGLSDMSPDIFEKLCQNNPVGDFNTDWKGWLASWKILNGKLPVDEELAMKYTKALYIGDKRNAMPALKHINCMNSVPEDLPEKLNNIDIPFMVIHGTDDLLIPIDNGEFTAKNVSNSRFVSLDKAGHMFFNRQTWEEMAKHILAHIQNAK